MGAFNATILWDDSPVDRIEWRAPDAEASNGMPMRPDETPVPALVVEGDHVYTLHIPFNGRRVGWFPHITPKWGIRGTIYLGAEGQTHDLQFNLSDGYKLPQDGWSRWRAQFET